MRTRDLIALILFLVAGLPLIANSWLQYQREVQRIDGERDRLLQNVSRDLLRDLRGLVDNALENARADGGMPGMAELLTEEPLDRLLANRYLTSIGSRDPLNITSVALLDLAGRNRVDTDAADAGRDESAEAYFQRVRELGVAQLVGPFIRAGDDRPGLYVAAAVRDRLDRPVGALRVRYEPALIEQVLEANLRAHPSLGAQLVDPAGSAFARAGQIMTRAPLLPAAIGVAADVQDAATGQSARAFAEELPRSPWRALVFEPEQARADLLAAKRQQWLVNLGLLVGLLLVAAWLVGWLIARPVVQLTQAVDAIAAGDLQRRLRSRGTREFRRLADAVNAMNQALARNLAALSEELRQRSDAEGSLRASEERLSTLIEQLPGAVYRCLIDAHWTMEFLSRRIDELTGYPADQLLHNRDRSYASLIHPDDVALVDQVVGDAVAAQRAYDLRYRVIHRDGSLRWVWERGQAHFSADGVALWLDGVLFDVTEQQQAERAMQALRTSTEGRTGDDYFDQLTRSLCVGLGVRLALVGRHSDSADLVMLAAALDGQPIAAGALLPAADACAQVSRSGALVLAQGYAAQFAASPLDLPGLRVESFVGLPLKSADGSVSGVVAVLDDRPLSNAEGIVELLHVCAERAAAEIERSDAQRALLTLADQLEQRVAQRTAELESSSRQLSQAMEQVIQTEKLASLGSLVAGVAHELNTPIGNALTAATALQDLLRAFQRVVDSGQLRRTVLTQFVIEGEEAGDLIERNLHRAAHLIGHFKQVAVDQSSARRRRFDLRITVEEVLTTLHPRLKRTAHTVDLQVDSGIQLESYPGPFEQVLTNLISNSLDHGFRGIERGRILIAAQVDGDGVRVSYQDNGVGIPLALQKRVFDPFFTTRLGTGGSGLGLYLVYSLVTGTLGGRLNMVSEPGGGTCFELDLPRNAPVVDELEVAHG